MKYLNVTTDVAILRVPRDHYRTVWSAITLMTHLQNSPCSINTIHIGGMYVHMYVCTRTYLCACTYVCNTSKLITFVFCIY